jgi:hypothetical protein
MTNEQKPTNSKIFYRIAWEIAGRIQGKGPWYGADGVELLRTIVDNGNEDYGQNTHWIEVDLMGLKKPRNDG